jgi:2-(1,2-epoxy-1,2-dihydrophenyl)acetyl-CoA isomerase
MSDVVLIEQTGHARIIRLNRPEKKNALDSALAWGVVNAVRDAAEDDDVWVIGITGTGDAFCAGLDLSDQGANATPMGPISDQLDDLHWVGRFLLGIRDQCDKPVVAGINGVAVGAGLGLAMACDIRLMSDAARLMAGYTRIGGSPDGGLTWTLPLAMGYEPALRFMLENRTVLAEEARSLGMVGEICAADAFDGRFREYLAQIASWSPFSIRMTKRGMHRAVRAIDLESQMRMELSNIRRCFETEDAREARKAFFEKRAPRFSGR